ncbi:MAG: CoA pyrophosphatase [Bacteroidales bacterium]|nr:CoA pyrophosphatase [Bacteroidales bacterium]
MATGWIAKLKKELEKPLPGNKTQMLMAPSLMRSPESGIPIRDSGVLLLLYPINSKWFTVFIKRTEYGGIHSGQISFPGGKVEKGDISLIDTALRESYEEIGIYPDKVEILGKLTPLHIPVSNYKVLPVVGYSPQRPCFSADPKEVEHIIEAEIGLLRKRETVKKESLILSGVAVSVPYYDVNGHHIWGATAMILSEFLEVAKSLKV